MSDNSAGMDHHGCGKLRVIKSFKIVLDIKTFDPTATNPTDRQKLTELLIEFKDVFANLASDREFTPYQYSIEWIKNQQPPLEKSYQKQFPAAPARRESVSHELARLVDIGMIVKPSSAANITMIAVMKYRARQAEK